MAFQPFGFRFTVETHRSVEVTKSRLRSGLKSWFDMKSGPRGWVVGPFVCLWLSAFDRHGPMVFGIVRENGAGTTITGRAGADLNGTLMFALLFPAIVLILGLAINGGQMTITSSVFPGLVFGLGLPLTLWLNSADRHQADPLVRFIERSVAGIKVEELVQRQRGDLSKDGVVAATLTINGDLSDHAPSAQALYDSILALQPDEFLILAFGPEDYMQTARNYDRFILERRDGHRASHFAVADELLQEQVADEMLAYLGGNNVHSNLEWKKVRR